MKIQTSTPLRSESLRRGERTRANGGGFADVLSGEPAPSGAPSAAGQLGGLTGLLSIQEVEDEAPQRRRAIERAEDLLDQLEALRNGFLAGRIPHDRIVRLMGRLKNNESTTKDPRLSEVIADIELRVAVELAKLERQSAT